MITIHLQVEDDYIDAFMKSLPKDKVVVIEENFKENQITLHKALKDYENDKEKFTPYYESMKKLSSWFEMKQDK